MGVAPGLGLLGLLQDWDFSAKMEVLSDSSQRIRRVHVNILPVRGENKSLDLFTKAVNGKSRWRCVKGRGIRTDWRI